MPMTMFCPLIWFPRTRGDRPLDTDEVFTFAKVPPHPRG